MYEFKEEENQWIKDLEEEESQWIKDLDEELAEDLKDLEEEDYGFPEMLEEYLEKYGIDIDLAFQEVGDPVKEVKDAWNVPGRAPGYHSMMQAKLRQDWPVLAAALDRL